MSAPRARVVRRPVHGVLLLDKPLGLSSNNALQKAKWLLRAEKAGHTGTLDPLATGVLPLCFGAATKFSQLQLEADKTYEAVAVLGVRTSTGDAEGEVVASCDAPEPTFADLEAVRLRFTGPIRQVPPMHSALKKDGRALYEYARAGQEVEREPRDVVIHSLSIDPHVPTSGGRPTLRIVARVSKGTYIRTLGEDIGQALGCGAHLSSLRRIATGHFGVGQCVTLEALEAMDDAGRMACLLPPESLLVGHSRVLLGSDDAGRFLSGLRRRGAWADEEAVAVFGPPAPSPQPSPASGRGSEVTRSGEGHALSPPSESHSLSLSAESHSLSLSGESHSLSLSGESHSLSLSGESHPLPLAGEGWGEGSPTTILLGTAHIRGGELIPGRLLSPIEIQQIQRSQEPQSTP